MINSALSPARMSVFDGSLQSRVVCSTSRTTFQQPLTEPQPLACFLIFGTVVVTLNCDGNSNPFVAERARDRFRSGNLHFNNQMAMTAPPISIFSRPLLAMLTQSGNARCQIIAPRSSWRPLEAFTHHKTTRKIYLRGSRNAFYYKEKRAMLTFGAFSLFCLLPPLGA